MTQLSELTTGSRSYAPGYPRVNRNGPPSSPGKSVGSTSSKKSFNHEFNDSRRKRSRKFSSLHDCMRRSHIIVCVPTENSIGSLDGSWVHTVRNDIQEAIDSKNVRAMSLGELTSFIHQLFHAAAATTATNHHYHPGHSTHCTLSPTQLKAQSIESLTYCLLDRKYGVRNVSIRMAASILCTADKFEETDWRVAVFVRAFRGDVDEDFYFAQQELVSRVRHELSHLRSASCITEKEWMKLLHRLYRNQEDISKISVTLRRCLSNNHNFAANKKRGDSRNASSLVPETAAPQVVPKCKRGYLAYCAEVPSRQDEEQAGSIPGSPTSVRTRSGNPIVFESKVDPLTVTAAQLEHAVATYELEQRVKGLQTFKKAFDASDGDSDGLITCAEFYHCCKYLLHSFCPLQVVPAQVQENVEHEDAGSHAAGTVDHSDIGDEALDNTPFLRSDLEFPDEGSGDVDENDQCSIVLRQLFPQLVPVANPQGCSKISFSSAVRGMHTLLLQVQQQPYHSLQQAQ
jgi:hypothetical protein